MFLINQMEISQATSKGKKNSPLILTVLNRGSRGQLKQMLSPSSDYSLLQNSNKKMKLEQYKLTIPRSKLLSNLMTYQWRHQTQFPIVRTHFVKVMENKCSQSQIAQMQVQIQHCPLKLTQIYEMPVGQAIYVLKESMIGFERLFNRVGAFQIFNSMIAINERGLCRVWLNDNFGTNTFIKKTCSQSKMVSKIITIIQSHSQESRTSKKIFNELRQCESFLKSLKCIEKVVKDNKILIPKKFISPISTKQVVDNDIKKSTRSKADHDHTKRLSTRLSVKDQKLSNYRPSIRQYLKVLPKSRKNSNSPTHVRRFNTQYAIKKSSAMKNSDETAHTGPHNRSSNVQPKFLSSKKLRETEKNRALTPSKKIHSIQQYLISDQAQFSRGMAHSVTFRSSDVENSKSDERNCSYKLSPTQSNSPTKYQYFSKKSIDQPYFSQFEQLLNNDENEEEQSQTRNFYQTEQKNQLLFMSELKGKVIKSNGWVENVQTLNSMADKMEQSFHESHEDPTSPPSVKLEKLDKIGRNLTQTSMFCDDHSNVFI